MHVYFLEIKECKLNTKSYYKNCSSRSSNSTVYYSVVVVVVVEVLVVYLFINGDISK